MSENKTNDIKKIDEKTVIGLIGNLIKQYPNDYELGKSLRKIYKENESHFKVLSGQQS